MLGEQASEGHSSRYQNNWAGPGLGSGIALSWKQSDDADTSEVLYFYALLLQLLVFANNYCWRYDTWIDWTLSVNQFLYFSSLY